MKLSIVIPTYNEKENIPVLVKKINSVLKTNKINGEIIIVDDNSPDGTGQVAEGLKKNYKNIKVVHRAGKLGLSSAVLDGFKTAKGQVLGVMDADLSHPPEAIPKMFDTIKEGADFVIGSRYTKEGSIKGWTFHRKFISRGATILAKPFTKAKDPMSGFLMIRKKCLEKADINPKGFKICLELLVKSKYKNLKEVPITFTNRRGGKSKASFKEAYFLMCNLSGYQAYKKPSLTQFIKFIIVGATGTVINLATLYTFTEFLNIYYLASAFFAFVFSVTNNFILNKVWTFKEKLIDRALRKYTKFFIISTFSLMFNLTFLYIFVEQFKMWYMFAQVLAIAVALIINFLGNKLWTFKQ